MGMPDIGAILGNQPLLAIAVVAGILYYVFVHKKK